MMAIPLYDDALRGAMRDSAISFSVRAEENARIVFRVEHTGEQYELVGEWQRDPDVLIVLGGYRMCPGGEPLPLPSGYERMLTRELLRTVQSVPVKGVG